MTPEQWENITGILEEALDRPEKERSAFLEVRCAGDDLTRKEVKSLLQAHERADSTGAFNSPFSTESEVHESERKSVGPYRIVRRLGRGGMGTVYLAEREETDFEQIVALKLVRRGLDTEDILSRFRYERQILASLDHPNIARLFDGGSTDDGQPYLVMEYVDGIPITEYCDGRRLSIRERLNLFRTVCSAVNYAHQNLVVHRDLKPSNILVTKEGLVKLLDFGIAKLISEDVEETDQPVTQTGMRLMTPEYASPEQIRGEPITTTTDVYQLGVLLYELLTGRRPYRLHERQRHEIERVILEEHPDRPSTAITKSDVAQIGEASPRVGPSSVFDARSTTADSLRRGLRGDLDNIVLKALRKETARRYESAERLSTDIGRHLSGHPVGARKDTNGYRFSKFVSRHKSGVALVATVLVLLAGFTITLFIQQNETVRQRDRAQAEAAKSERVISFLQGMLSSVDPAEDGREVTVAQVLDQAAANVEEGLEQDAEIEADVRRTIGITYQNLGMYEEAEVHLRKAYDLRAAVLGSDHVETAESVKDLALVYHWMGDLDRAADFYRQSIDLYRSADIVNAGYSEALNDYGTLLMDQGLYAESEQHFRKAYGMSVSILGEKHMMVASNLVNLGLVRHWQEDVDAADSLYHQALVMQTSLVGNDHIEIAYTLNNLGWVYIDRNDFEMADSLFRRSLAIREKALGDSHPSVALAMNNLATLVHFPKEDYGKAESLLENALEISRISIPGNHPTTAIVLNSLARLRERQGSEIGAEPLFKEAAEMRTALFGSESVITARSMIEWAACLIRLRRFQQAESILVPTYEALQDAALQAEARNSLIALYEAWGKPGEAAAFRVDAAARDASAAADSTVASVQ